MILIRTNISQNIGLGHYMRMIRLAKLLPKKKIIFAIDFPNKEFEEKSFKHLYLYKNYRYVNEKSDSEKILNITRQYKVKTIIVDDYRINENWEKTIKKKNNIRLIVFDDFYTRKHFCDYYINSKILKKNEIDILKSNLGKKTKLLLGPKYSIINSSLRKKFNLREKKNITFYAGGGGDSKIFYSIIKKLCYLTKKNIQINLIISLNKNYLNKFLLLKKKYKNFNIFFKSKYEQVINRTHLFVGCQGNAIYENSYLKKLSILFPISKNQINENEHLFSLGHFFLIKKNFFKSYDKLCELFLRILRNYKKLTFEAFFRVQLVDNWGAKRISELIFKKKKSLGLITKQKKTNIKTNIRKVTLKDMHLYLNARNLNQNKSKMINKKKINLLDHYNWWLSKDFQTRETFKLCDKNNKILLFIWHKKIEVNGRDYYVGGWFVNSNECRINDVYSALRWQILATKKNKTKWICVISRSNKFVLKINKLLGFIEKFNNKTDLANSKKYFKVDATKFKYLIYNPV